MGPCGTPILTLKETNASRIQYIVSPEPGCTPTPHGVGGPLNLLTPLKAGEDC